MYEVNGWIKFAEEDIYKEGCQLNTTVIVDGQDRFIGNTIEEVIEKCKAFVGMDDDENVLRDSCDEEGRVDIQVMETDDAYAATKRDLEDWKKGKKRLWLACYTFMVEAVERKTVSVA